MSFSLTRLIGVVLMIGIAALFLVVASSAQVPELVVELQDSVGWDDTTGVLSVFMSNYQDTVAGFSLWLQLDRPDLILFQYDSTLIIDTTYWECTLWVGLDCFDSIQVSGDDPWDFWHLDSSQSFATAVDTTGTLTSGWQYVEARSLSGMGTDVKIAGLANMYTPPFVPGIAPQEHGALVRIPFDVIERPVIPGNCTVNVFIQHYDANQFCFATPAGECIGWNQVEVPDTTFFKCLAWAGEVCLNWQVVPSGEPYDSLEIAYDSVLTLDTSAVLIYNDAIEVCEPYVMIGDFDCNGWLDITDLVALVNYMFQNGPPSACPWNLDCDDDGVGPNIADLVCLVSWMFPPGN